jgi:hypothetical protein
MYALNGLGYKMLAQQIKITPTDKDMSPALNDDFNTDLIFTAMLATHDIKSENFDLSEAKRKCGAGIASLNTKDGLQTMLSAQMLTIHQLQQKAMAYVNGINNLEIEKYYTNVAIKLSHCFVQQANLLAKLQGHVSQKITVERVDVHQGGQAIVGNIQRGCMGENAKK